MKVILNFILITILKIVSTISISYHTKVNLTSFKFMLKYRKKDTIIRGGYIGSNVNFLDGFNVFGTPEIYGNVNIGKYTTICGPSTRICSTINTIEIGNYCSIASNVIIQEFYHRMDLPTTYGIYSKILNIHDEKLQKISKGSIIISDDVWIGSNSVILSGVKIGRGAIIGAGAVVTKDVDPYTIVGGNPAKTIRKRFSDNYIQKLELSKWWTWGREEILQNKDFFLISDNDK